MILHKYYVSASNIDHHLGASLIEMKSESTVRERNWGWRKITSQKKADDYFVFLHQSWLILDFSLIKSRGPNLFDSYAVNVDKWLPT